MRRTEAQLAAMERVRYTPTQVSERMRVDDLRRAFTAFPEDTPATCMARVVQIAHTWESHRIRLATFVGSTVTVTKALAEDLARPLLRRAVEVSALNGTDISCSPVRPGRDFVSRLEMLSAGVYDGIIRGAVEPFRLVLGVLRLGFVYPQSRYVGSKPDHYRVERAGFAVQVGVVGVDGGYVVWMPDATRGDGWAALNKTRDGVRALAKRGAQVVDDEQG